MCAITALRPMPLAFDHFASIDRKRKLSSGPSRSALRGQRKVTTSIIVWEGKYQGHEHTHSGTITTPIGLSLDIEMLCSYDRR